MQRRRRQLAWTKRAERSSGDMRRAVFAFVDKTFWRFSITTERPEETESLRKNKQRKRVFSGHEQRKKERWCEEQKYCVSVKESRQAKNRLWKLNKEETEENRKRSKKNKKRKSMYLLSPCRYRYDATSAAPAAPAAPATPAAPPAPAAPLAPSSGSMHECICVLARLPKWKRRCSHWNLTMELDAKPHVALNATARSPGDGSGILYLKCPSLDNTHTRRRLIPWKTLFFSLGGERG